MRNDLAVASETIQAIVDGRSEPNQAMLRQALDALGDAEARLPGLRDALRRGSAGDDLLAAIIEGSPYAKVLVDERGRITLVNAQAEQLFGYSRDELLVNDRDARPRTLPPRSSRVAGCVPRGAGSAPDGRGSRPLRPSQGRQRSADRDRTQPDHDRRRDVYARRDHRHHRTQARRGAALATCGRAAACCRARRAQSRACERIALQDPVRCDDEPRAAHAADGDHRIGRTAGAGQARRAPRRSRPDDRRIRRGALRAHQQHPRFREDRSGQDRLAELAASRSRPCSRVRPRWWRSWRARRASPCTRTSTR